ncbi:glycosyltransferase [Flavobacterium sp. HSC-61S13]|uniref:glycosyltransferase n=1 Tax=Flavobacterium sp. HSC-61S13 TaxID=2910963 RepID=UPI00209DC85F|nr:glycosyltransferase [Flavobacterium sp. HSC-61S13]MCP1995378.1 glycosyltransferase involved in cell wall biosynthesis [Flavobacterium sp. HSC-61S13]
MENFWSGKQLLVVGLVWPEPGSSAAGSRMIQLIRWFLSQGMQVRFACAAGKSDYSFDLPSIGVQEEVIRLNDDSFDVQLTVWNPDVVLFDRFMIEEQYGWRVAQSCPDALRILDTEDLHFLRYARQDCYKKGIDFSEEFLYTDRAKREIASIYRSDATLIISEYEMNLLTTRFKVDAAMLFYLPFLEEEITTSVQLQWPSFEERRDFLFIGNFIHEPNWNTVQVLKTRIWPELRKNLPGVKLHIYGAYASEKVMQLHQPKEGFLVHGRAEEVRDVFLPSRILLAPIQFGAGVKGKFVDAMKMGTPCVTTSVGAEGMKGDLPWNGYIADTDADFIERATHLYSDKGDWEQATWHGIQILNQRYASELVAGEFLEWITDRFVNLQGNRQLNFTGQMLLHHSLQSTKYMSLWIQAKNS